jgi:hypothetical protein
LAAYAMVAMRVTHRRHVGVEERLAMAPSCDGHGETYELTSVKRAENLPSRFGGYHEQRNRDNVKVGGVPDFSLEADTGFKFFDAVAMPE